MPNRRDFLKSTGAALAVSVLRPWTTLAAMQDAQAAPLFKISLAQWSLHKRLYGREEPKLDNLDFAKTARGFGIEAVEYVNSFFKEHAKDEAYLTEMKKRADGEGVKSLLIMVDGEGALGDADEQKRKQAIENHHRWVEAAKFLGCHSIRVNAASSGSYEEQQERAADGLRRLTEFATEHELNVIVENHGGLSSNGAWLAGVMKKVDHPRCGTLPDFGNFNLGGGKSYDRYQGVEELMPYAKAVSAKTHDFDDEGNETHTDYFKMMKIVLDADYHGYVGIEYEGSSLPEDEGIRKTKALLERVRKELAQKSG
ncbi:MAG: sugar phosphate isomerase/epimerase family protein [Planctomycetota bacterium]